MPDELCSNGHRTREESYAKRLRKLRLEQTELSQVSVGRLLGIHHTTVSRHESGQRHPPVDLLLRYARTYGVRNLAELFIDLDGLEVPLCPRCGGPRLRTTARPGAREE